jgi:hypothetical protein
MMKPDIGSAWASAAAVAEPEPDSGPFMSLAPGGRARVAPTRNAASVALVRTGGRVFAATSAEGRAAVAAGRQPRARVVAEVLDVATGRFRLLEVPRSVGLDIAALMSKYGPCVIEVSRDGDGVTTRYLCAFDRGLHQEEESAIAGHVPFDLSEFESQSASAANDRVRR